MSIWVEDIGRAKDPLRFIAAISRPYRWSVAGTFVFSAVAAAAGAASPLLYKHIVDALTEAGKNGGSFTPVYVWALVYVALFVASVIFWRICYVFGKRWAVGVRLTGRYALTSYILKHGNQYYENRFAGSVANKINHARDGARSIVENVFMNFWPLIITFVVSFIIAFITNPLLGYIFFGWLAVVLPLNVFMGKKRVGYVMKTQRLETKLRGTTVDILGNIRAVKEYAREMFEASSLRSLMKEHAKASADAWTFSEKIAIINGALQALFILSMLGVSIYLAQVGAVSFGSVILALSLVVGVGQSIFHIGNQISHFSEQWGEIKEGLDDLLNAYDVIDEEGALALAAQSGGIEFKNVTFAYGDTEKVLSDFSLTVAPGEKVGIVGRSGAGKSTLVKLLLRHYDLTRGNILIDGQDIRSVLQQSVRESIALVPQEPLLFHRSVAENISYGKLNAAPEEIERAALRAKAAAFIGKLPERYDTLVGERGVKLSGGERQRIAIARALLKNASILVLDEATSSLDSESEQAIQEALRTLMKGKTVIAIAHRLSTLREMDRILVLDQGKILEEGTHEELLARKGLYAQLWAHQSGGYIKDEDEEKSTEEILSEEEETTYELQPV